MLSSSLSKVARRSTPNPLLSTISSRSPQVSVAASSRPFAARTHQRRYSSSKTSNPPSDDPRAIAAASEAPAAKDGAPVVEEEVGKRPATRLSRRKSKDASIETVEKAKTESIFNLPSVPSTHHLHPHGAFRLIRDRTAQLTAERCSRSLVFLYTPTHICHCLDPSQLNLHRLLFNLHAAKTSTVASYLHPIIRGTNPRKCLLAPSSWPATTSSTSSNDNRGGKSTSGGHPGI